MKDIKNPKNRLILIILISSMAVLAFITIVLLSSGTMKQKKLEKEIQKWEEEYRRKGSEIESIEKKLDSLEKSSIELQNKIFGDSIKE